MIKFSTIVKEGLFFSGCLFTGTMLHGLEYWKIGVFELILTWLFIGYLYLRVKTKN